MAKADLNAKWYRDQLAREAIRHGRTPKVRKPPKRTAHDFKCPICNWPFKSQRSLISHRNTSAGCKMAPEEKDTPAVYSRRHFDKIQKARGKKRFWKCPCGRRFETLYGRGTHQGRQPVGSVCRPQAGQSEDSKRHSASSARKKCRMRRYSKTYVRKPDSPWSSREFRSERERQRYYKVRYGLDQAPAKGVGYMRSGPKPRYRYNSAQMDVPSSPTGHVLYERARAALKDWEANELGSDLDSIAQDLIQAYVLAVLSFRNPIAAMNKLRRQYSKDAKVLVRGLSTVDDLKR